MPQFHNPGKAFPICEAVIYGGPGKRIAETVLCPIKDGEKSAIPGHAGDHMKEIFVQLDEVLADLKADKSNVAAVTLYVEHVREDIAKINEVYKVYFAGYSPSRCAVGTDLQANMLVEAHIRLELPA